MTVMKMRDDFAVFILSHGRPDRIRTIKTLRYSGYTGRIFIVIDDEDKSAPEYIAKYGEQVLQFSKAAYERTFDEGDNFDGRRGVVYARNACFDLARSVGCNYFIQLDDDYTDFKYRTEGRAVMMHVTLDGFLEALVDFLEVSGALTVAMSQGGDYIGGVNPKTLRSLKRKAMNTFVCSVKRPFKFDGRINEDVTAYVTLSRVGGLFFTVMQGQVDQTDTQKNPDGMTVLYLDMGTYVKSFYSVIFCPSAVRVAELVDHRPDVKNSRLHHRVNWNAVAPRILDEKHRRV